MSKYLDQIRQQQNAYMQSIMQNSLAIPQARLGGIWAGYDPAHETEEESTVNKTKTNKLILLTKPV